MQIQLKSELYNIFYLYTPNPYMFAYFLFQFCIYRLHIRSKILFLLLVYVFIFTKSLGTQEAQIFETKYFKLHSPKSKFQFSLVYLYPPNKRLQIFALFLNNLGKQRFEQPSKSRAIKMAIEVQGYSLIAIRLTHTLYLKITSQHEIQDKKM